MEETTHQQTGSPNKRKLSPAATSSSTITISLRNLTGSVVLGFDAWSRPSKPQPLHTSIYLTRSIKYYYPQLSSSDLTPSVNATTTPSAADNLDDTVNYSTMASEISTVLASRAYSNLELLTRAITRAADKWPGKELKIEVKAPKALVRGGGLERTVHLIGKGEGASENLYGGSGDSLDSVEPQSSFQWSIREHDYTIPSLRIACIIGVNPHERREKQDVIFKIQFHLRSQWWVPPGTDLDEGSDVQPRIRSRLDQIEQQRERLRQQQSQGQLEPQPEFLQESSLILDWARLYESTNIKWQDLVPRLCQVIEATSFQTVEALGDYLATWLLSDMVKVKAVRGVTVTVEKPVALPFVDAAGASVKRMRFD